MENSYFSHSIFNSFPYEKCSILRLEPFFLFTICQWHGLKQNGLIVILYYSYFMLFHET